VEYTGKITVSKKPILMGKKKEKKIMGDPGN